MPVLSNSSYVPVEEKFDLTPSETYYFDLSGSEIPGEVNTDLPDSTLHYVPFTYAGTINAYSHTKTGVSTNDNVTISPRSLFIADCNVTRAVSWNELNDKSLIFGKSYMHNDIPHTLRAPLVGSSFTGNNSAPLVFPTDNEWDTILNKSDTYIKHWNGIFSLGQDTNVDDPLRSSRGKNLASTYGSWEPGNGHAGLGYRPVLEVYSYLDKRARKPVTLNLNGGSLDGKTSISLVVYKSAVNFTAPGGTGLTAPANQSFAGRNANNTFYPVGSDIPSWFTTLTAQWVDGTIVGDFVIKGGTEGTDYSYDNNTLTIKSGADLTISGTTTTDTIRVEEGATNVNLTLSGLSINGGDKEGFRAFDMTGATVMLTLADATENLLIRGNYCAGLTAPAGSTLTICGSGTLEVESGAHSAGIGGDYQGVGGTITIKVSAHVKATGGDKSAGIGGGAGGENRLGGSGGNIIIKDNAMVNAMGGKIGGAGIGGKDGAAGNITIMGNAVVVTSSKDAYAPNTPYIGAGSNGGAPSDSISFEGGVIFEGSYGKVYGNVMLTRDWDVNYYTVLTIPEGASLTVGEGNILTNNATIKIAGELINNGTITENGEIQYLVTWNLTNILHYNDTDLTYASANYGYYDTLTANQVFELPENIIVEVNGVTLTSGYTYNKDNGAFSIDSASVTGKVVITATTYVTYTVTSGADATWRGYRDLSFTINAPHKKFVSVMIDGNLIDGGYYTTNADVSTGGTILTIKQSYLNTLINRNYALSVNFTDGGAETSFTVNYIPYYPVTTDTYYTITANAGEGGSITPNGSVPVRKSMDMTFYIYPDDGFVISDVLADGVSVTDMLTNNANTFKNVTGNHSINVTFKNDEVTPPAPVNPFTDVTANDWFFEDVLFVNQAGLMQGTGNSAFSPAANTTRGMIVTILYRMDGEPAASGACPFGDVKSGSYYEKAITWAAANGIAGGYGNGKFGPEDLITREQLAAILYRYADYRNDDVTETADLTGFSDNAQISSYAITLTAWANANDLINGKGSGILDPKGDALRCEVAAILHRFYEKY